jgi:hypothetical protein
MIQSTSANSSSERPNPRVTAKQIASRQREIQAEWTLRQLRRRAAGTRRGNRDLRFQAHLKFVAFLLSRAESCE